MTLEIARHDMALPTHPGTITFVEGTTQTVEQAADVPESIRFAKNAKGELVPVVKVVAYLEGDRRIIREYGADGAELRSTVQVRRPA
jgi:hypothetical protein